MYEYKIIPVTPVGMRQKFDTWCWVWWWGRGYFFYWDGYGL